MVGKGMTEGLVGLRTRMSFKKETEVAEVAEDMPEPYTLNMGPY